MRHLQLTVTGMGCRRCVRDVTARLRDVPGVQTLTADAATSLVRLSGAMTREDVLDALRGTTYVVDVLETPASTDSTT